MGLDCLPLMFPGHFYSPGMQDCGFCFSTFIFLLSKRSTIPWASPQAAWPPQNGREVDRGAGAEPAQLCPCMGDWDGATKRGPVKGGVPRFSAAEVTLGILWPLGRAPGQACRTSTGCPKLAQGGSGGKCQPAQNEGEPRYQLSGDK